MSQFGWKQTDSGDAELYCRCSGACKCYREEDGYYCENCEDWHEEGRCEEEEAS
jgi:hypothetical protein